jgi:histidine ammonia-lyase
MGANAATKLWQVVSNLQTVLAIELFTASQALEFRRPIQSSPLLEQFVGNYRKQVKFVETDRVLYLDIEKTRQYLGLF